MCIVFLSWSCFFESTLHHDHCTKVIIKISNRIVYQEATKAYSCAKTSETPPAKMYNKHQKQNIFSQWVSQFKSVQSVRHSGEKSNIQNYYVHRVLQNVVEKTTKNKPISITIVSIYCREYIHIDSDTEQYKMMMAMTKMPVVKWELFLFSTTLPSPPPPLTSSALWRQKQ